MGLTLAVERLEVKVAGGRTILAVDSFAAEPGSSIGIRGPSGAGKSTFLYALAGLAPTSGGAIRWGGTDIAAMGETGRTRFRRENIGMVFQDFLLFEELSALANAALPACYCRAEERSAIRSAADRMLAHLGLGDYLARSVATFSGGERQRVAIARALAGDPAIILADEPTASLDRETADRLIDDLAGIAAGQGKTLIAVSHDPALQARMDRCIELVDGHISERD